MTESEWNDIDHLRRLVEWSDAFLGWFLPLYSERAAAWRVEAEAAQQRIAELERRVRELEEAHGE